MNKNNRTVIIVALAITVVVGLLLVVPGFKRDAEAKSIGNQIDALNISAPLKSKECNGGDGIDSGPQCSFVYQDSGATIESTLKNAGYVRESGGGNGQLQTFVGGNPKLRVNMNTYNGTVTLEVYSR
jgi:hypothetical protein